MDRDCPVTWGNAAMGRWGAHFRFVLTELSYSKQEDPPNMAEGRSSLSEARFCKLQQSILKFCH